MSRLYPVDNPYHACMNASCIVKFVKYVVVMGQGYDSSPLLDMRIHDINVEAETLRNIPQIPAPVHADATPEGVTTTEDETQADIDLTQAMQALTIYWTGWWPLLHVIMVYEIIHPETTMVVETHEARNLAGVQEFRTCSVNGDASILEPSSEEDEWIGTLLETAVPAILGFSIVVAGAFLESLLRSPAPNPIAVCIASAALSSLALWAVILPSVFAYKMVQQGDWTRNDAGRYLFELAFGWLLASLGILVPTILGEKGAAEGIIGAIAKVITRLAWLAELLKYALVAGITILLIGVALLIGSSIWLNG